MWHYCTIFLLKSNLSGKAFKDVDQLIEKVKSATVSNKTRQAEFVTIGCPPQPIVIRCESWLNSALYYAKNLPKV